MENLELLKGKICRIRLQGRILGQAMRPDIFFIMIFSLLIISQPNATSKKPLIIFIGDQDHFITEITDSNDINKITSYVHNQSGSNCMADYSAYYYYSKDSMQIKPIWKECCGNVDQSIFEMFTELEKTKQWRIFKFVLPVINDPQNVLRLIKDVGAYPMYNEIDTNRLFFMDLSYTLKCNINRDSVWNYLESKLIFKKYIAKTEIEHEPYGFNVKLYFNNLNYLAITKELIEKNKLFQIHEIKIPTMIEYTIFTKINGGPDIYDLIHKEPFIPYMQCE